MKSSKILSGFILVLAAVFGIYFSIARADINKVPKGTDEVAVFNDRGSVVVRNATVTEVTGDIITAQTNIDGLAQTWIATKKSFGSSTPVTVEDQIKVGDKVDIVGITRDEKTDQVVKISASQINKRSAQPVLLVKPEKDIATSTATSTDVVISPTVEEENISTSTATTTLPDPQPEIIPVISEPTETTVEDISTDTPTTTDSVAVPNNNEEESSSTQSQ